jgi:hypothetical protein
MQKFTNRDTRKPIELSIESMDDRSVTFRRPAGRMVTLSRKEFDARYESPRAPTSPAPSGFDPELGAPRPRPPAFDSRPGPGPIELDAKLDDILEAIGSLNAKVSAMFRIVVDQPRDEDDAPPAPPASSTPG